MVQFLPILGYTSARKPPASGGRISVGTTSCSGGASFPGSGSLRLKRSQAEQGEPVRMALAGHQFPRAFAITLGTSATHETPMVQEELQQAQIRTAQMAAQSEVGAQPRIEVLHQRTTARCLRSPGAPHSAERAVGQPTRISSRGVGRFRRQGISPEREKPYATR